MSETRFARELGAEFERLERTAGAGRRRRHVARGASLGGQLATAAAVVVTLAVAALAIALLSHAGERHTPLATGASGHRALGFSGGNCRAPAPPVTPGSRALGLRSGGLINAAGGHAAGLTWQLRTLSNRPLPYALEHGQLRLGARRYGLCSPQALPVAFGLINTGADGVVYGYVTGGGSYRVSISAGGTPLASTSTDTFFFLAALPRSACAYRALSITAVSTPVRGLPPDISRSLDADATRLSTTMRFGGCPLHALVSPTSERGRAEGRSPNAPLAHIIAQERLTVVPGGPLRAGGGTVAVLTHAGLVGISVLAFGLPHGHYALWLLGSGGAAARLASVTDSRRAFQGAYDLPRGGGTRAIAIAGPAPHNGRGHGPIVLRATLPADGSG